MGIRGRKDLQFQSVPILDCYSLLMQTQDPVLRDVRIRTAIALTIDAPALTKAITRGTGVEEGLVASVLRNPGHEYTRELLEATPILRVATPAPGQSPR
jgi:ABC-type oligopeptide transport system substrate-binding subunit